MALDLSAYYNRFDRDKSYKRHLFKDSMGFQSAEGNEQHDFTHDNFRMFTEATLGDGAVLQGSIARIDPVALEVSLEEGSIITEGYVVQYIAKRLTINMTDTYIIGVAVLTEIITENEDIALKDPALGTVNYNQPGGHRLKVTGRWCFDDDYDPLIEKFYPIHKIVAGKIVSDQPGKSDLDFRPFWEALARYDRDSHGHYVVEGVDVIYASEDATNFKHNISVTAGLSHVFGYEVRFHRDRRVKIDWAMDEKFVNNESAQFTGDGWYVLRKDPVSQLGEIFGVKEVTQDITHGGYIGCQDELPQQPVVIINSVSQGAVTYVDGVDYVQNGDHVDWSLGGSEPSAGSTYEVSWEYNDTITSIISEDRRSIQVTGLKIGTIFYCDYYYYQPRYDKISLLRNGKLFVTKGTPADIDDIKKPVNNEGLPLASLIIYYGREPIIEYEGYRAYRMSDIKNMQGQISELRYNVSRLAQMADLSSKDPTTDLKNMFVDPFHDDDLRDLGLENKAIIFDGILNPYVEWERFQLRTGVPILLGFTPKLVMDQSAYTKTRRINEFDYAEIKTVIDVDPASMRWVSDVTGSGESPDLIEDVDAEIPLATWLQVTGGKYASGENVTIYMDDVEAIITPANNEGQIDVTFEVPPGVKAGTKQIAALGATSKALGTCAFVASAVQLRTAIVSMVSAAIEEYDDSVALTEFDRRYGDLPEDLQETVQAYIDGGLDSEWLWEHFTECLSWGDDYDLEYCVRYDPLAQTFRLVDTGFITSCKIYFTKIPENPAEIVEIAIHNTQVGFPDRDDMVVNIELFAEDLVANAWNTFEFKYPIKLTGDVEYAMVVFTKDTDTYIRIAELGGYDLEHNTWLSSQVHSGVLLQSANRSTWSSIETEDMTFQVCCADFVGTEEVHLGDLSLTDITDINLTATAIIVAGTAVEYRVELPDRTSGTETVILSPGKTSKIEQYTGVAKFYVVMSTTDSAVSPSLDGDIAITVGKVIFPSDYISREFSIEGDNLKVYVDIYEPNNGSVNVYYQDYTAAVGDLGEEIVITAVKSLGEEGNFLVELIDDPAVLTSADTFVLWDDINKKAVVHIRDGFSIQNDIVSALISDVPEYVVSAIPDNPGVAWNLTDPAVDTVTLSGGDRWKPMTPNAYESTSIGSGWVDTLFEGASVLGLDVMRVKIELDTTNSYNRPYAENLRSYIY